MKTGLVACVLALCICITAALPTLIAPQPKQPSALLKFLTAQEHLGEQGVTDGVACPICLVVVENALVGLKDPANQAEIVAEAKQACSAIPVADLVNECTQAVDDYSVQIFEVLNGIDANEVCASVGACGDSSPASPKLKALASDLIRLKAGLTDDNCETCQLVQAEAVSALQDPSTQKEILQYAKDACAVLQTFQAECESTIDVYGPLALSMAESYIRDPGLCATLGFCASVPFTPLGSVAAVS